jgi:hypothetical protein
MPSGPTGTLSSSIATPSLRKSRRGSIFDHTYDADHGSLVLIYVMPIGLSTIGWRMYIINASWNIVTFFLIVSAILVSFRIHAHPLAPILGRDERFIP